MVFLTQSLIGNQIIADLITELILQIIGSHDLILGSNTDMISFCYAVSLRMLMPMFGDIVAMADMSYIYLYSYCSTKLRKQNCESCSYIAFML